jgi:hypothetical protein
MGLRATHFPRSAQWSPEHGEDGDGYQHLLQLTWAPGFDQSCPRGWRESADRRLDCRAQLKLI